jgi:hypothetical protein
LVIILSLSGGGFRILRGVCSQYASSMNSVFAIIVERQRRYMMSLWPLLLWAQEADYLMGR